MASRQPTFDPNSPLKGPDWEQDNSNLGDEDYKFINESSGVIVRILHGDGWWKVNLSRVETNGGWYDHFLAEENVHYAGVAEAVAEEFGENWQEYV
jgi:hypothetical protein